MKRVNNSKVVSKLVCLCILFFSSISIATDHVAVPQDSENYPWFAIGVIVGALTAFIAAFYFTKHFRHQYLHMQNQLKQALKNVSTAEQAFKASELKQQESQDLLEERVQERTLELHIALQELESANQELERKNVLDELTGLHNRRFYDQKIQAEYRRSRRNLTPLSLVIIDIDHFKSVNDNYGHLAGDQCLVWLSKFIKESLKRSADKAFRYGGEEFCLILPDTESKGALLLSEQLRKAVSQQGFQHQDIAIPVTISCGISTYQQEKDITPEQIFANADKALYHAKNNGRNQSVLDDFIDTQPSDKLSIQE